MEDGVGYKILLQTVQVVLGRGGANVGMVYCNVCYHYCSKA